MERIIVVVGAGSTGTSTAYHLSKEHNDVILIDKAGIAAGMTAYSTAVVRTHYSNEIVARMALDSRKIFESDPKGFGFNKVGMIQIVPEELKEHLFENVNMLRNLGINEELYSSKEASEIFKFLRLKDGEYVVNEPDSGYADPVATANYFAGEAFKNGAKFLKEEVIRVYKNGKNVCVELKDRTIEAEKAVLCTNVWTNTLLSRSGIKGLLPIKVSPHPVLMFKRPGKLRGKFPVIADLYYKNYYRPDGESLFFGGSIDVELDKIGIDPEKPNQQVSYDYILSYTERLTERIPEMKEAGYQDYYIGLYDNTPDEEPIIDSLEAVGLENVYVGVGLSGHGFKLSPVLGNLISKLATSQEDQYLKYFKLSRFKENSSIFKAYEGIGTVG